MQLQGAGRAGLGIWCKLIYTEWINKVLLLSTENYIQYPVISHKGKEFLNKIFLRIGKSFPNSSVCKESTCNAGDPSSISGSGRSPREGIGYPLQYSWAFLVAQLVKSPPAMRETWV